MRTPVGVRKTLTGGCIASPRTATLVNHQPKPGCPGRNMLGDLIEAHSIQPGHHLRNRHSPLLSKLGHAHRGLPHAQILPRSDEVDSTCSDGDVANGRDQHQGPQSPPLIGDNPAESTGACLVVESQDQVDTKPLRRRTGSRHPAVAVTGVVGRILSRTETAAASLRRSLPTAHHDDHNRVIVALLPCALGVQHLRELPPARGPPQNAVSSEHNRNVAA